MNLDTVIVYTEDTPESYLQLRAIGSWKCNYRQALGVKYVIVCKRGGIQDKVGLFVVKVSGVTRTTDHKVNFSFEEYAEFEVPDLWPGNRNPVTYVDSDKLGIDYDGIDWKKVVDEPRPTQAVVSFDTLTIDAIKLGLAMRYKVSPDDVEIKIKL